MLGYPVFLVGLVVKDSAYQCRRGETGVQSLGEEDPLEEEMGNYSCIHAWKNLLDRGVWWATDHGVTKRQTQLRSHTCRLSSALI